MRWTRTFVALSAVAAVLLPTTPAQGAVSDTADRPPAAGRASNPVTHSATLLTGDRVIVTQLPDRRYELRVLPGPGRKDIGFIRRITRDQDGVDRIVVIPDDARPLVSSGALDGNLFDVAELVRQHRDDKSRSTLPLLVSSRSDKTPAKVGIAKVTRRLPSLGGSSVVADKNELGKLWASLITHEAGKRSRLKDGVTRIWLDGEARLTDEQSNSQVGAPAAWEAGYTGKGVTVAVLDGGYDATHPDFGSTVAEGKDFTHSPDGVKDTFGHGTHVASTIAGSGAASGGKHKGVAPDARLLVGKVCGAESCDFSAVLAGMEWAAQRAKIVNMSLGSRATDGTDPLSAAVNRLSAQYGTLFVVAVGNSGSASGTVATPAAADAALAVGSVSKTDRVSGFSSRGPRFRDFAVKPDIAAPGESIVAARAAGTSMGTPVDDHHTMASGTSMAGPHVAAGAAILAQQHPDWSGKTLKAALTSTAKPVADAGVFDQGGGRVDLVRAVKQTVRATTTAVDFGLLKYPQTDLPPVTKSMTYTNDGDAPITLSLQVTGAGPGGAGLPDGAFAVADNDVTVPAHGTATVDLTATPKALLAGAPGSFGGRVTATGPDGATVTTPFAATTEPESFELTVKAVDRAGKPASPDLDHYFDLVDLDSGDSPQLPPLTDGVLTVRVPKATYGLNALVDTPKPGEPAQLASRTWASVPQIVLDKPTTVTLDAREGTKIEVRSDKPDAVRHVADIDQIYVVGGAGDGTPVQTNYRSYRGEQLYAIPVEADPARFDFGIYQTLLPPPGSSERYAYYVAQPSSGGIPDSLSYRVRDRELGQERALYRAQGVDALGTRSSTPDYLPNQFVVNAAFDDIPLPSRRMEFYSAREGTLWSHYLWQRPTDVPEISDFDGHVEAGYYGYKPGERRTHTWNSAVLGSDISMHPWNRVVRLGDNLLAQVWPYSPGDPGHSAASALSAQYITAQTTLAKEDGTVIGTTPKPWGFWAVPAEKGRYTLEVKSNRSPKWASLAPETTTTWSFLSENAAEATYQPLLTLSMTGPFDTYNRVPDQPWFPLKITVGAQAESTGSGQVEKVTVEQSADDGKTWQRAKVKHIDGDTWGALLARPSDGARFVSLRVKAEAANGDLVEQTTIRAYGLKG
ncbi:S8 family serine peptidase [Streptomyces sp. 8N616]|uniref:S8 family serine peptidase n=1 Tax=Streptomyces sp. 8N616 TaxID=3457414 RepID=UPI003FD5B487